MDWEYHQWIKEFVNESMTPAEHKLGYSQALEVVSRWLLEEIDAQPAEVKEATAKSRVKQAATDFRNTVRVSFIPSPPTADLTALGGETLPSPRHWCYHADRVLRRQ